MGEIEAFFAVMTWWKAALLCCGGFVFAAIMWSSPFVLMGLVVLAQRVLGQGNKEEESDA